MAQFFQIYAFPYEDNPMAIGRRGVAFVFTVFPNGNSAEACSIKVIFTPQLLSAAGKQFIAKPFITKEDQPKFLRYAFYRLKQQLEDSNLSNRHDILIDHTKTAEVQRGVPRYCELRVSYESKWYCIGNPDKPMKTSYQLLNRILIVPMYVQVFPCDVITLNDTIQNTVTQIGTFISNKKR